MFNHRKSPFDQDAPDYVEDVICIRVDGVPFPVEYGWSEDGLVLADVVEAAQCDHTPGCLGRHFQLRHWGNTPRHGHDYVCMTCGEPYTIRAIPEDSPTLQTFSWSDLLDEVDFGDE
jgi:hypothetical protein